MPRTLAALFASLVAILPALMVIDRLAEIPASNHSFVSRLVHSVAAMPGLAFSPVYAATLVCGVCCCLFALIGAAVYLSLVPRRFSMRTDPAKLALNRRSYYVPYNSF